MTDYRLKSKKSFVT